MFVPSDQYRGGEPLPERPRHISFNLKQFFMIAVVTATAGSAMMQASRVTGPFVQPSRLIINDRGIKYV